MTEQWSLRVSDVRSLASDGHENYSPSVKDEILLKTWQANSFLR